jgi:hypothetical protein
MGHRVVVVAPQFEGAPESERDVIRIPAIQHFNGSDFSLVLPVPGYLAARLEEFKPDIVHSHHPHLLGGTAFASPVVSSARWCSPTTRCTSTICTMCRRTPSGCTSS